MADFNFQEEGLIDYKYCWNYQEQLFEAIIDDKIRSGTPSPDNFFLLVEHPPVYTLGKSGDPGNLLIKEDFLREIGALFYRINRGGDITYHGPGQLVGYPVLDLEYFHMGVREYIHKMEESVIQTLAEFGVLGTRKEGAIGVWLHPADPSAARKICAIGVRVSRYVTMHGFALNVNTDLRYFEYINPCGFTSKAVTSMEKELGHKVEMVQVRQVLKQKFNGVF